MDIYHMINWFFALSFFGYLLECIVLTYEYKTPVVNRGFVHGPFCIIYGFGALGACILLGPIASSPVKLYLASSAMATVMELVTACLMIHFFGSFWWDYSHKLFNYKGIICLESSIGWGFWDFFSSASLTASSTAWWAISRSFTGNGWPGCWYAYIFVIFFIPCTPSSTRILRMTSLCLGG